MANEGSYEAASKRSDEIAADLEVHPEKYTMLTGDRPTGRLHLGHYFGTVDRAGSKLQDMGVTAPHALVADYQVITDRDSYRAYCRTTCTTWSWITWRAASIRTRP